MEKPFPRRLDRRFASTISPVDRTQGSKSTRAAWTQSCHRVSSLSASVIGGRCCCTSGATPLLLATRKATRSDAATHTTAQQDMPTAGASLGRAPLEAAVFNTTRKLVSTMKPPTVTPRTCGLSDVTTYGATGAAITPPTSSAHIRSRRREATIDPAAELGARLNPRTAATVTKNCGGRDASSLALVDVKGHGDGALRRW